MVGSPEVTLILTWCETSIAASQLDPRMIAAIRYLDAFTKIDSRRYFTERKLLVIGQRLDSSHDISPILDQGRKLLAVPSGESVQDKRN